MRCVSLCDWNRAVKYLKMSVESHVVAYGTYIPMHTTDSPPPSSSNEYHSQHLAHVS